MAGTPDHKRWVTQLSRLETLMDVVFALVLWRLFELLPRPTDDDTRSVLEVFTDDPREMLTVVIGIVIVIIYWLQNNLLFGHLERTDSKHSAISILQIFSLLLFLFAISAGTNYEAAADLRLLESVTAMMVGVISYWGWRYAKRTANLVSPSLSEEAADAISIQILAEPLAAAITIPFAIFTPLLWEAAWFSYPIIAPLLRRRQQYL